MATEIEWTDETWNPVTGCTKISPGCAHCYAEAVAKRLWRGRSFGDVRMHMDRLDRPRRWRRPRRIFVNSMSDLFHRDVPFWFVSAVLSVMEATPRHIYQVLTKRPKRMLEFFGVLGGHRFQPPPPSNLWLGVSVENQETADWRIPMLLDTPAALRFVSAEPLLGPIDISTYMQRHRSHNEVCIDWLIIGGESGQAARPCDLRSGSTDLLEQCDNTGTVPFVKQLGRYPVIGSGLLDTRCTVPRCSIYWTGRAATRRSGRLSFGAGRCQKGVDDECCGDRGA